MPQFQTFALEPSICPTKVILLAKIRYVKQASFCHPLRHGKEYFSTWFKGTHRQVLMNQRSKRKKKQKDFEIISTFWGSLGLYSLILKASNSVSLEACFTVMYTIFG